MNNWKTIVITPEFSLIDTMKTLENTGLQFVIVLSPEGKLLGSVTDGDIRRGLLRNVAIFDSVSKVMNVKPLTLPYTTSRSAALKFLVDRKIKYVPLVDSQFILKDVIGIEDDQAQTSPEHTAVLMVGGLGSRLGDLTTNCPKPMLKVGNKPLLEMIVENLKEHGFTNFIFCVNYKAEIIKEHFKHGEDLGISIRYVHESKRMGTAGALALLPKEIEGPLLIMNGDIITKVNFTQLLDFHRQSGLCATMAVRQYDFQIPYGVVKTAEGKIKEVEEKPVHSFLVNAGIYILEKECIKLIPKDEFFDMPQFFETLIKDGQATQAFPIHEYWLDIGREDDLAQAQSDHSGSKQ